MPTTANPAAPLDPAKDGMFVVITGSGSALADPLRGGASVGVLIDGTLLQFDLGRMALENLLRVGLKPTDIDYLFFTHHHFDHIASLGYFLISNWIAGRQKTVQIMGPKGTVAMVDGVRQVHAGDMEFGVDVHKNWPSDAPGRPAPQPPHRAEDVAEGEVFSTNTFTVRALKTVHYTYPGAKGLSLGYRVDSKYGSVVISGDTGPMDEMSDFAHGADILIHEAQRPDPGMTVGGKMARKDFGTTLSGLPRNGGGHTSPREVGIIAARANVKRVVPIHLPPYASVPAAIALSAPFTGTAASATIWDDYRASIAEHFKGEIAIAEDAMWFEVGADSSAAPRHR